MSLRLRLLKIWMRRIEKPRLNRIDPLAARARFERSARLFRDPPFALYLHDRIGGVAVTWASVRARGDGVILWLHGGAHLMGSARTHRGMLARLSGMTGCRACLPDFRLAPEHPFPAALDDALAVWDGLLAKGYPPGRIVLGGDSSGGGLMLALLAQILARGQRPAAALAFSPWVDLTGGGASLSANAVIDPLLPAARFAEICALYLGAADPEDPRASPVFADFPFCPPVWLHAAQTEILADDTRRMAGHLRRQGAEVELDLWHDLPHVVAILHGWIPEADMVLRSAAGFIRRRIGRGVSRCHVRRSAGS